MRPMAPNEAAPPAPEGAAGRGGAGGADAQAAGAWCITTWSNGISIPSALRAS